MYGAEEGVIYNGNYMVNDDRSRKTFFCSKHCPLALFYATYIDVVKFNTISMFFFSYQHLIKQSLNDIGYADRHVY